MQLRHFLILLILCTGFNLHAQNKPKQWEIGVDLLPLLDKNKLPEKTFLLRYHLKDKNRAWRLRGGFFRNPVYPTWDPAYTINDVPRTDRTVYLRPGLEWQFPVADKAAFYLGVDVPLSLSYDNYKAYRNHENGMTSAHLLKFRAYRMGLSGFAGARYQPTPWLSFSMEASGEGIFQAVRQRRYILDVSVSEWDLGSRGWQDRYLFDYYPIGLINIGFHF